MSFTHPEATSSRASFVMNSAIHVTHVSWYPDPMVDGVQMAKAEAEDFGSDDGAEHEESGAAAEKGTR